MLLSIFALSAALMLPGVEVVAKASCSSSFPLVIIWAILDPMAQLPEWVVLSWSRLLIVKVEPDLDLINIISLAEQFEGDPHDALNKTARKLEDEKVPLFASLVTVNVASSASAFAIAVESVPNAKFAISV